MCREDGALYMSDEGPAPSPTRGCSIYYADVRGQGFVAPDPETCNLPSLSRASFLELHSLRRPSSPHCTFLCACTLLRSSTTLSAVALTSPLCALQPPLSRYRRHGASHILRFLNVPNGNCPHHSPPLRTRPLAFAQPPPSTHPESPMETQLRASAGLLQSRGQWRHHAYGTSGRSA